MATDLTQEVRDGQRYEREGVSITPHYFSSPAWLGVMAGRKLVGQPSILKARMGRGFAVNIETAEGKFIVRFIGRNLDSTQIVRLA